MSGVHDEEILRSAITTPFVGYYPEIYDKAAALLRGIACNHGFNDGNKRTANFVTEFFIRKSGYRLNATDDEIKALTLSLVMHELSRRRAAEWFRDKLEKVKP
ncbi:MAG: type II toxin-antitoxin system death-on-curing family toxin [Gammaproteobacteria bacterium]|nr:type II toxin-antitoxin system death-on-curing family toxin [Gammaproteobacteria bacterium]